MIRNNNEHEAVRTYNDAIKYAHVIDDQDAADLKIKLLKMEEVYFDWAEMQRSHI